MLPHVGKMMKQTKEMLKPKMNNLKLSFSYMDYLDSQLHVSQMLSLIYNTVLIFPLKSCGGGGHLSYKQAVIIVLLLTGQVKELESSSFSNARL